MAGPTRAPALSLAGQSLVGSLLTAALALPAAVPVRADAPPDRATIGLKVLDYADKQPGQDRVRVRSPSLQLTLPYEGRWRFEGNLVSDTISGASPTYHSEALARFDERRRAGQIGVTRYFEASTVSALLGYSSESDYVSRNMSLQASVSSDDRNTTWTAGLALGRDRIDPTNEIVRDERKNVLDLALGMTRVLGRHDVVQVVLGHARMRGYLSDPYKALDERPRSRETVRILMRWNHHVPAMGATLRWSYRATRDNWRLHTHALALEYVQPLAWGIVVTPAARLYTQSAARFYIDVDPDSGPFLPQIPADMRFSTLDQRMSAMGARSWSLKLAKRFGEDWMADVRFERYEQRSSWRLDGPGSPGLMPVIANIWQFGLSRDF